MLHLVDGLLFDEPGVFRSSILGHFRVKEVLIDGGELIAERLVQLIENLWVALHDWAIVQLLRGLGTRD